jgi:hypothetical protein
MISRAVTEVPLLEATTRSIYDLVAAYWANQGGDDQLELVLELVQPIPDLGLVAPDGLYELNRKQIVLNSRTGYIETEIRSGTLIKQDGRQGTYQQVIQYDEY